MDDTLLTSYLPTPDQVTQSRVLSLRDRLETFINSWLPQLDTRPNSVFGDIILTPDAICLAPVEEALRRLQSDLNFGNLEQGLVYNRSFVTKFLENFGVSAADSVSASGIIRLTFNADKTYVIDSNTVFTFGAGQFKINPDEGSPVTIFPVSSSEGKRLLTKTGSGEFVVHLPVTGTSGITVEDGAIAGHSLTHAELVSVIAAGDFDPGKPPESLPELVKKARSVFASANLTSRSGTVSFVNHNWPQMIGVSAVLTGDRELLRDGNNILGISEGVIDIYLRSKIRYVFGDLSATLTYDNNRSGWVGRISFPVTPAFFSLKDGIFQVSTFQSERGVNTVYSRSADTNIDNLGVAYSSKEQLGVVIQDTNPQDFTPASNDAVKPLVSDGTIITLSGEYAGGIFNASGARNIILRFNDAVTVEGYAGACAEALDQISGETVTVYFKPFIDPASFSTYNGGTTPQATFGVISKDTGYQTMFNGLEVSVIQPGGIFDPVNLVGQAFQISFKGKTANFSVNYLYDPMLIQVDNVVQNPDNKPVGTSILVKSFVICHISSFVINYRLNFGATVDTDSARSEIFSYLNSIVYPDAYEESRIGEIIMRYGAAGLQSVTKRAIFYPSLGSKFIKADGTSLDVPRYASTTLAPAVNDFGFGLRNISYLIDVDTITFNATVI